MESAALNPPPAWLERIVLFLTPALAREAVAGDLWETYRSPGQYAREALATLPLVVASQMRRNLNLPKLMLQLALAEACFGGGAPALLAPVLMLRDAYQPAARPSHRSALRQAVLVAFLGVALVQSLMVGPGVKVDGFLWVEIFFGGFMLLPFLCLIRAGLVMEGDRGPLLAGARLSDAALADECVRFARRMRSRERLEAAALLAAALFLAVMRPGVLPFQLAAAAYAAVAAYLVFRQRANLACRLHFQRALSRERQMRCFLWWLWLAPVLLAVHARLAENGLAAGRPMPQVLGITAAILLCYPVTALNREQGGRIEEQIRLLEGRPLAT